MCGVTMENDDQAVELRPQPGFQSKAMTSTADVTVVGGSAGSGKSHIMLMRALMNAEDPHANIVYFRRTGTQLTGGGGLWDEAKEMYMPWKPKIVENTMKMTFKSGCKVKFSHMEHVKNRLDHQGLQYHQIYFDEATHFEEEQVTYLMSRLRSKAKGKSQMFLSCNPDPDSFLATWIDWWLDEDGYADPEKSGVVRHYATIDGQLKHAETADEIKKRYPAAFKIYNPLTKDYAYIEPKTITFIGGTIFDNPALIAANPNYLAELNSLPEIEKQRLLHGNWYLRAEGSSYYSRKWLKKATHVPKNAVQCRAWDKAATEKSEVNRSPDYTASTKMSKCPNGDFYITGDYHEDNHDKEDEQVLGRFRETPGRRDLLIERQSLHDGTDCIVIFSKDPGQAGVTEFTESAKKLVTKGFKVKQDPMPTQNSKLTRYSPFSSACEVGIVYIVESTFTRETLDHFHKENEAFDGERSSRTRKDDFPDSAASAYNFLCGARVVRTPVRNQLNKTSLSPDIPNSDQIKLRDLEKIELLAKPPTKRKI